MERLFKKNVHLSDAERKLVAKKIKEGETYKKVSDWYFSKYARPMPKSTFYDLKKRMNEILKKSNQSVNTYTRPQEEQLSQFECHLKEEIAKRTESVNSQKWTHSILQLLALHERAKPPFCDMEILQSYQFSNRYWMKFLNRQNLVFSSRKSDQKFHNETQLSEFRNTINGKLLFYRPDQCLNMDESGVFFHMTKGRILVEKGTFNLKVHLECSSALRVQKCT